MDLKRTIYLFPLAFLLNASSMTVLLIGVGVLGRPELAADIAIVQGATLAVFFAFSANARSIILGESSRIAWPLILRSRVFLMAPVGGATLIICLYLTDAAPMLAVALVLRRCSEWISEIHLARSEREKNFETALWFILAQSLLLLLAVSAAVSESRFLYIGLFLWALVPMGMSAGFLRRHLRLGSLRDPGWAHMLPHFGSTAITGITVFVFRLVILLIAGKVYAGNLFTAFAIGGILGSVFAQALGPTLVFHAREGAVREIPRWLMLGLAASALTGLALVGATFTAWPPLMGLGKPEVFWTATGASLIGGAVMVIAQRYRLRLLQRHEDGYVFGPDVLTNVLIVACVPYVYYLLGGYALSWLFFINSVIALVFYVSADRTIRSGDKPSLRDGSVPQMLIGVGLLLPIFFQLKGDIFREKAAVLDSGGNIFNLPIPVSVLVCYGSIVIFGSYWRARESLSVIFACFALMVLSAVISTQGNLNTQQAKIILLIQFILPMFAMVLGQIYVKLPGFEENISKSFLFITGLVIPLQLIATWNQNLPLLSPYLYFFSIYQHLQYVPTILVCAFIIAVFSLWKTKSYKWAFIALAAPMGAYSVLSLSRLTTAAVLSGAAAFVLYRYLRSPKRLELSPVLMLVMIGLGLYGGMSLTEHNLLKVGKSQSYFEMMASARTGEYHPEDLRANPELAAEGRSAAKTQIKGRIETWRFYLHEIGDDVKELAFGHEEPPDRGTYPSAHNYYLDFTYNFGLLATLPILWLVVFTMWKLMRNWEMIFEDSGLFALTGVVLFLVLIDNSLKVGLRQPYPGVASFFLWGLLISKLRVFDKASLRKPL